MQLIKNGSTIHLHRDMDNGDTAVTWTGKFYDPDATVWALDRITRGLPVYYARDGVVYSGRLMRLKGGAEQVMRELKIVNLQNRGLAIGIVGTTVQHLNGALQLDWG